MRQVVVSIHHSGVIAASLLAAVVITQFAATLPHATGSAVAATFSSAVVPAAYVSPADGTPWG